MNLKGVSPSAQYGQPLQQHPADLRDGASWSATADSAITYANPPTSYVDRGQVALRQDLLELPRDEANGVAPSGQATIGPNLQGVGTATVDFWITTGRMPAADVKAVEAERKPPVLTNTQALEVAAYINSWTPRCRRCPRRT